MRKIITVRGEISPKELGFCQSHEHIAMRKGRSFEINPALCIDDYEKSRDEMYAYKRAGGDSIVEAQPVGCCRDAGWLKRISEETGVHILSSTGFHKLSFYPDAHWIRSAGAEELERIFVEELTEGMYEDGDVDLPLVKTEIRAGLIKTAYDTEGLTPRYRTLFDAAAASARRTDRVMMIHVEQKTNPVPLQDYLLDRGVSADQMMFCHMDRACEDIGLHRAILAEGSYLEFDTIGRFKYHSDEHEAGLFRELIAAGYEDRLLYSLDTTRERLKTYNRSAVGMDYILTKFNRLLKDAGVPQSVIRKISTDNPARLFGGCGP